jgi:putative hemolysin
MLAPKRTPPRRLARHAASVDLALRLLLVAVLILFSAFFVVAEYALVTARRHALTERAEAGDRRARVALRLMDDPVRVISTAQIGITALGILLGAVGEAALRDVLDPLLATSLAFLLGFLVVTYLSVAFGELVPKAIALHDADRVALLVARPIAFFSTLFRPAVSLLQKSAGLVLRPLGIPSVTVGEPPVGREELRSLLREAEEQGELHPEEEDMLSAVIDLRKREARDVMVPWEDVHTVDATAPAAEVLADIRDAPFTRYPATDGRGGPVVGVLHARDVWTRADRLDPDADVRGLLRPAVIVPPTVHVDALLRQLRRARQHMAVVVDEYGRPVGLATLEDALEEIVGEIEDEFDRPDARVRRLSDSAWLVDGGISISDFNRTTGAELPSERAHSVGGLVYDLLGRVAQPGDRVEAGDATLVVETTDDHRIDSVRVSV